MQEGRWRRIPSRTFDSRLIARSSELSQRVEFSHADDTFVRWLVPRSGSSSQVSITRTGWLIERLLRWLSCVLPSRVLLAPL